MHKNEIEDIKKNSKKYEKNNQTFENVDSFRKNERCKDENERKRGEKNGFDKEKRVEVNKGPQQHMSLNFSQDSIYYLI